MPLYRALAAELRRRLHPGVRLPSSRELAAALGVSRNTVLRAYDLLRDEGLVVGRHGSGTYAATRAAGGLRPARSERLSPVELGGAAAGGRRRRSSSGTADPGRYGALQRLLAAARYPARSAALADADGVRVVLYAAGIPGAGMLGPESGPGPGPGPSDSSRHSLRQ